MIEYLTAAPPAVVTVGSFAIGAFLVVVLVACVVMLICTLIEEDPWHFPTISGLAGLVIFLVLFSGVYKSYEPIPHYTKEECELVLESLGTVKPYKSTTTYDVSIKTYKNIKNDETFTIRGYHGTVYPKQITCYRVEK